MQTIRTRSIAALGAIAATFAIVSFASPAQAETVSVSYRDLDLHSASGQTALRYRIKAAAAELCGPDAAPLRTEARTCRRDAVARAMASIPAAQTATRVAAR